MALTAFARGKDGNLADAPLVMSSEPASGAEWVTVGRGPACLPCPVQYRCARESQPGGLMRQQTKPFIIECKPSRKPKLDALKPSIWGRLDTDIARGLQDQSDMEKAAADSGNDRA